MTFQYHRYIVLCVFLSTVLLMPIISSAQSSPPPSHGDMCARNPEVVDEAADRLLVHYYCSYLVLAKQAAPTLQRFGITLEFNSTDAAGNTVPFWGDNDLPTACNEYVQELNDRYSDDPAMATSASARDFRDTLIPKLNMPRALMRHYADERERNRRANTIGGFLAGLFGIPTNEQQASDTAVKYSRMIHQEITGQAIKTPALARIAEAFKARADIFLSLWNLQSDLSPGCDDISITNWGYRDGRCYRIKAYTPMFLEFLTLPRDRMRREASGSVNCDTLMEIYQNYLGEDGLELEYE